MKKILLVEDDLEIINLLELHLSDLPATILKATDGEAGLELALTEQPDLVLLDLMLPKMDGIEVCRRIKQKELVMPIIMLTAKSEEIDRIIGLEMGADDYITKPFSVRELLARVKAVFRFQQMIEESLVKDQSSLMKYCELAIDIEKRKVTLADEKVELSPKEFELLVLLASSPGRSYSRGQLLNLVWGYDFDGYEHTINSTINRLRAKIEEDMSKPKYILTQWGVGYSFNEEIVPC